MLSVPARFRVEVGPDGTWSAWDEARVVDVHLVSTGGVEGRPVVARQMLGLPGRQSHEYRRSEGRLEAYADLLEEDEKGKPVLRLASTVAVENRLMACWCTFSDRDDLEWALDVWHSISNDWATRDG
ncbi:MAG: hypothetical protein QOE92_2433 [Chloroflexota bacterium]|nr:hypothetical protein [Chloroflexota bacterium]